MLLYLPYFRRFLSFALMLLLDAFSYAFHFFLMLFLLLHFQIFATLRFSLFRCRFFAFSLLIVSSLITRLLILPLPATVCLI